VRYAAVRGEPYIRETEKEDARQFDARREAPRDLKKRSSLSLLRAKKNRGKRGKGKGKGSLARGEGRQKQRNSKTNAAGLSRGNQAGKEMTA